MNQVIGFMSKAQAEVTKGKAYLMLNKDATPESTSFWVTAEEPVLRQRGITVIAVDPSSGEEWNDNYLQ